MKICRENPNMIQIGQECGKIKLMKTEVRYIVACDFKNLCVTRYICFINRQSIRRYVYIQLND